MPEPDMTLMRQLADRARLAGGGGSSNDGGMEIRIAALEADMREVKGSLGRIETLLRGMEDRLRRLEIEMAEVKGRVSQLPTIWTIFGMILAIFGAAFGLLRRRFSEASEPRLWRVFFLFTDIKNYSPVFQFYGF